MFHYTLFYKQNNKTRWDIQPKTQESLKKEKKSPPDLTPEESRSVYKHIAPKPLHSTPEQ